MSNSFTIMLLTENTLGRYFQLATLSIYFSKRPDKLRALYGALDKGFVLTSSELVDLAETVRDFLITKYGLEKYDPCQLLEAMRRDSPRIYRNDRSPLASLFFPAFNLEVCGGVKKTAISFPEIAISFIEEVISKNGMIKQRELKSMPALFGALIFSEKKTRGSTVEANKDNISLAIGALGVMASYAGRLNVARQEWIELYVLPDGSFDSLSNSTLIYTVLFSKSVDSWKRLAQSLTNLHGVSIERALLMASSIRLSSAKDEDLRKLVTNFLPEKFILLRVKPEQRPNILGVSPLTSRFVVTKRDSVLIRMLEELVFASLASKIADKSSTPLAECMNYLTEAYLTMNKTHLVECARLLIPLYFERDIPDEFKNTIARLLEVLSHAMGTARIS